MVTSTQRPSLPRTPSPTSKGSRKTSEHSIVVKGGGAANGGEGDGLDKFSYSPTKSAYDPVFASPRDDKFGFPSPKLTALPTFVTTTYPSPENDSPQSRGGGNLNGTHRSSFSIEPRNSDQSTPRHGLGLGLGNANASLIEPPLESPRKSSSLMVEDANGVFNFHSSTMPKPSLSARGSIGQRKGHKYKHSSVSHSFFLEPPPRAPLSLPNSLPVPTIKECRRSMSRQQTHRVYWSICHMAVAAYTLWSAEDSQALTALSHLILFDSLGAMLCVVVDVLSNFEVWKRSSIRHPFGLERAEVLAGFAMSVLLLFMGLDLISHNIQHVLEGLSGQEAHEGHHGDHTDQQRVSAGEVDSAAVLAILATLVSAVLLKNHARIGKVMRFAYMDNLPSVLSNPSHFLTISCSSIMLLLPLLSIQPYIWLDRVLSMTIAVAMCGFGIRLVRTLGFMLLMSYDNSRAVSDVMQDIESDPSVSGIQDARFWQVHYGLCIAGLKLSVRGTEEGLGKLRERIQSVIRGRLGGAFGSGGCRWEVNVQLDLDRS